jgi:hypothetical protein
MFSDRRFGKETASRIRHRLQGQTEASGCREEPPYFDPMPRRVIVDFRMNGQPVVTLREIKRHSLRSSGQAILPFCTESFESQRKTINTLPLP